ncbi:MAG TPA: endo-1,4-beta-xylanase, partial [Phycisphaerae bacterium]|nr:endo-1,4-beta-xylanase [Phycisphaerae bacterium]
MRRGSLAPDETKMQVRDARMILCALLMLANPAASAEAGDAEASKELSMEQIKGRIQKYRTAAVALTVSNADGRPLANTPVTVRQVRHKFLFGSTAIRVAEKSDSKEHAEYQRRFAELLNYGTLPFYWGGYERVEGSPRAGELRAAAEWCRANGIRVKGHPLCWHNVCPDWLRKKKPDDVLPLQLARIEREVKAFAGLIDAWDVVNEAVAMPAGRGNPISALCSRIGRVELIKQTFAIARKTDPKAMLILNDYVTGQEYEKLIKDCLDAGAEIDAIGIQSHMHKGYFGAKDAWDTCRRLAKFGKPLHFTELTILSGKLKTDNDWFTRRTDWDTTPEGEKRQAKQAAEMYTVLFSHPAVEAITWWDFTDLNAWQGAPAGLIRKDMSPKPTYEELRKLVKGKWWTGEQKLTTDAAGVVRF